MDYTRFGQIEQTAPAAGSHLDTEDLAEIDRTMQRAISVGSPAPEAR
jgi:hypothetical protein